MMIGPWVAVALVVVAFIIGRLWGRREGVIKHFVDEIRSDMEDIGLIVKYHTESLPLMAKELMDDYARNKKFHEDEGSEMMGAVAFHYSRITDNLVALGLKSSDRAKKVAQALDEFLKPLVAKAESAEAAFVQQVRMAVDPKFREHMFGVDQKGFDRAVQAYGYLESYWEHTPQYRKENPYAP